MNGALDCIAVGDGLCALILEQVYRVSCMMPQQVIGPASRIACGVDVPAPEEIGLDVHLLDAQLAFLDPLVDPLMTWIEAAHVPGHSDDACFLLNCK